MSPISKLSVEVLAHIFATYMTEQSLYIPVLCRDSRTTAVTSNPLLAPSLVCKDWYEIIKSTSSLWSHLTLCDPQDDRAVEPLAFVLQRSKAHSLTIDVRDRSLDIHLPAQDSARQLMKKLAECSNRIESASFRSAFIPRELMEIGSGCSYPLLRYLELSNPFNDSFMPINLLHPTTNSCPRLETLVLSDWPTSVDTVSKLLEKFQSTLKSIHLCILHEPGVHASHSQLDPPSTILSTRSICLSKLRAFRFFLDLDGVLDAIEQDALTDAIDFLLSAAAMPQLTHLSVSGPQFGCAERVLRLVKSVCNTSSNALQMLAVANMPFRDGEQTLTDLSRLFLELLLSKPTNHSLRHFSSQDRLPEAFYQRLRTDPNFLPHLEELILGHDSWCGGHDQDHSHIFPALMKRAERGTFKILRVHCKNVNRTPIPFVVAVRKLREHGVYVELSHRVERRNRGSSATGLLLSNSLPTPTL